MTQEFLHDFYNQFVDEWKWENDNFYLTLNVGGISVISKKDWKRVDLKVKD